MISVAPWRRQMLSSEAACRAVHRFSGGVPRLINQICDNALVYGYAEQLHQIDDRLVNDVAVFAVDPAADPLRGDPRWQDLVSRLKAD